MSGVSEVETTQTRPLRSWWTGLEPYLALLAIFIVGLLLISLTTSPSLVSAMVPGVINAIAATSLGYLIRQNGLVSFGHAFHFGIGAYVVVLLGNIEGFPLEAAILAAIILPPVLTLLIGPVMLRAGGITFSLLSLALAQAVYEVSLKWRSVTNGDDGVTLNMPSKAFGLDTALLLEPHSMAMICWACLMATIAVLILHSRSRLGRLALAIKNNEERARFLGFETLWPRVSTFVLVSGVASLAGVLFTLYNLFVSPEVLHWGKSGDFLIMAIVGGFSLVWGPAVGALVFFLTRNAIGDLSDHWLAIMGALVIFMTVAMPNGVCGYIVARFRERSRT